jgi:epsilon-lactone hydrolase
VYVAAPLTRSAREVRRVYLDIHGGALVGMGGDVCRLWGMENAERYATLTYSVDYRMPPEHRYPASLDDCLTVYRELLKSFAPRDIIVGGSSAGANLAAALVLRARDEGMPMPAAIALPSPEIDLTESGDTFEANRGVDVVLKRGLIEINRLYANGHDLAHPYLSPLFGDFSRGFPPTFLQAGTRDIFLSNAARMHRNLLKAGVPVELHVFEAMPHGGFLASTPEDMEVTVSIRAFLDNYYT